MFHCNHIQQALSNMAVTEVALIRLKSDLPPTAKANLLEAQKAQEDYSKHAVHFLNQTTDRSFYYLVGGWESVEKHTHEWIQSETNQRLLGLLGQDFDVCWMFHLDIDVSLVGGSRSLYTLTDTAIGFQTPPRCARYHDQQVFC